MKVKLTIRLERDDIPFGDPGYEWYDATMKFDDKNLTASVDDLLKRYARPAIDNLRAEWFKHREGEGR